MLFEEDISVEKLSDRLFFSVVTSVYNAEEYILKAMNSVKDQTETDYEYIIVDNGSEDHSLKIVQSFIESNSQMDIKLIHFSVNQGISGGRNAGIEQARGRYICFLDADDYWYSNKLEVVRKEITAHPEYSAYCHWETHKKNDGECVGKYRSIDNNNAYEDLLFHGNCLSTSAMTIGNELLKKIGGFDTRLVSGEEDYDCWLRLALEGANFYMIKKTLGVWLIRDDSVSAKRIDHAKAVLNMLRGHFSSLEKKNDVKMSKVTRARKHVESTCYMGCGRALSLQGDKIEGNRMYRKAIKINPFCIKAYLGMALNIL